MDAFIASLWSALALGAPLIVAAMVALFLQWLRVRRAKLRAERLQLPPTTPPPPPWYSLRPSLRAFYDERMKKRKRNGRSGRSQ